MRSTAAFSTVQRRMAEGEVNGELAAKIDSELAMEKEMRDPDSMPEHLKEYLDNSPFKIQDTAGQEEVILMRTFGDEKIKVSFSIDDLNHVDEDADQMQDNAMEDEFDDPTDMPTDTQSHGANTKGAVNQGRKGDGNIAVAPEDSISAADHGDGGEESMDGEQEPSFPAHCFITIERAGKGALQVEAIAQDGLMVIENVYYYKNAKLVDPKTTQEEGEASRLYTGPPFANLDEDLQVLFEKFLDERGINTTMALFVPEYIDFKEQKEYVSWLNSKSTYTLS